MAKRKARQIVDRLAELRKARKVPIHDCEPGCFRCLVADYARKVRLQPSPFKKRGKR